MSIPLKVCPRHEQAYPVTGRCPYCEDRPKVRPWESLSEVTAEDRVCRSILLGMPRGSLLDSVSWQAHVPSGLIAWLGLPKEGTRAPYERVLSVTIDWSGPAVQELQFSCGATQRQTVFALGPLTRARIKTFWEDL